MNDFSMNENCHLCGYVANTPLPRVYLRPKEGEKYCCAIRKSKSKSESVLLCDNCGEEATSNHKCREWENTPPTGLIK